MELLKNLNYLVAFIIEITALIVYGQFGYQLGGRTWQKILLAGLFVGTMVLVWGRYLAPRANDRLVMPMLLVAKLGIMGTAVAMLLYLGRTGQAVTFGAVLVVHYTLAVLWRQV
ncbi:MAG TPA: YrdB family protein [Clostridiaceae bacterium]|nr:YrdB family protein [Clostridiaceae bacterium]